MAIALGTHAVLCRELRRMTTELVNDVEVNGRRYTHASTADTEPGVGLLNGRARVAYAISPLLGGRVDGGTVVVCRSGLCVQCGHCRSGVDRRAFGVETPGA